MQYGYAWVDGGYRVAIGKPGRRWTHMVYQDGSTVRVQREEGAVQFRPIQGYTLPQLARSLLKPRNALGLKRTIMSGARAILKEAAHGLE